MTSNESTGRLNTLAVEIHDWAEANGFYESGKVRDFDGQLVLVHSEVSEALEEWRDGHDFTAVRYSTTGKPEGIPTELADILIRVLGICAYYGIDIDRTVREKIDYNKSRPYRNGGKRS